MQRLLATAAAEWQSAGEETGYLLHGGRLDQFEQWAAASSVALTTEEQAFLDASLTARAARRAKKKPAASGNWRRRKNWPKPNGSEPRSRRSQPSG